MSCAFKEGQAQKKLKMQRNENKDSSNDDDSPTVKMFLRYQHELDAKYDKHERLVKTSRDLTIESKRIIFLLHRATSSSNKEEILHEAEIRLNSLLCDVINKIALELTKFEVYQFLRAFSPGLQEYVEAASFYHYLKTGNLIHINEVVEPNYSHKKNENPSDNQTYIKAELPFSTLLTPLDFILGIADLTGELMRKCISSVGTGDIEEPFKLCCVLQNIYEAFLRQSCHSRELNRKLYTLKCSLLKVENACYAIRIRGTEVPEHMFADFFSNDDEPKEVVEYAIYL